MTFEVAADVLSRPEPKRVARATLTAVIAASLAFLMLGGPVAAADDDDEVAPTESTDAGEKLSRRERRREERRRAEIEAAEAELAALEAEANADTENGRRTFVVAVEPEMECETVPVTGSRMPKRVCKPVGAAAYEEEAAQELLRRTRERSPAPPDDPFISSGLPGFQ